MARLASGLSPVKARLLRLGGIGTWWRGHRRTMLWSMGIAILVFACTAAACGWMTYRAGEVTEARAEARAVAEEVVPALLTYDPGTTTKELDARLPQLAEPFRHDFATLMRDVIAPSAQSSKIGAKASAAATGVVPTDNPDEVKFVMFLSQSAVSAGVQPQPPVGSQVIATLQKVDGSWLVSGLGAP